MLSDDEDEQKFINIDNFKPYIHYMNNILENCGTPYTMIIAEFDHSLFFTEIDCNFPKPLGVDENYACLMIDKNSGQYVSYCVFSYIKLYQVIEIEMTCTKLDHRRKFLTACLIIPIILYSLEKSHNIEMVVGFATTFVNGVASRSEPLMVDKLNFFKRELIHKTVPMSEEENNEDYIPMPAMMSANDRDFHYINPNFNDEKHVQNIRRSLSRRGFDRYASLKKMYNVFPYTKDTSIDELPLLKRTIDELESCSRWR